MVLLADVRRWDPGGVQRAFAGFGEAHDRLLRLDFALTDSRPPGSWRGPAAELAGAEHERLAEQLRRVVAGVAAVRPTVADVADAVTAVRRDLDRLDADAAAGGFVVTPDAGIIDAELVDATGAVPDAPDRDARWTQLAGRLRSILDRAAEIDATLADLLVRAATARIDDGAATVSLAAAAVAGAAAAELHAPPPPTVDIPAANAAWWRALGPAEHDRVLAEHPEWIGNLDGIPATVRDAANRTRLPGEIARLDAEIAAAQLALDATVARSPAARPNTLARALAQQRLARLRDQRAALDVVALTVATGDRQLLLLDVSGHGAPRAAVAVGNVDTATHVAVFTPGLSTTVAGDLDTYTHDVGGVRQTALSLLGETGNDADSVAGVAWLGYDAPQWGTVVEPSRSVALSIDAQHGGADLARFYDGINVSRPERPPHLTALGHSYGSTTTGYALQHTTTPVADAVLFGSPGLGTHHVGDLHVPAGHVAVIEARDDPVADIGSFGGDPNQLDGVTDLSARARTAPDGAALHESVGHSDYLTPGSTSQYNIAATVAGLDDHRIEGGSDGVGDWIRAAWDAL